MAAHFEFGLSDMRPRPAGTLFRQVLGLSIIALIASCSGGTTDAYGAERDSSTYAVVFEATKGSPEQFYRSGPWSVGGPIEGKPFFSKGGGGTQIKMAADLIASWDPSQAVPGCTVAVKVEIVGNSPASLFEASGGWQIGLRYRYNLRYGWHSFKWEGPVPVPNVALDFGWNCPPSGFLPFTFDSTLVCLSQHGDLSGWCLGGGTGGAAGTCLVSPNLFSWVSVSTPCIPLPLYVDSDGFSIGFPIPPCVAVEGSAGANFGRCVFFNEETFSVFDQGAGQSFNTFTDTVTYDIPIPCEYATPSNESRVLGFTAGPYNANSLVEKFVLLRAEPNGGACAFKVVDFTVTGNVGGCISFLDDTWQPDLNEPSAEFEITIVDPEVTDISPSGGSIATDFVQPVPIDWSTSWGAPDKCGCFAKVFYQVKDTLSGTWGGWQSAHPESSEIWNSGHWDWQAPPSALCQYSRLRIELLDPQKRKLAETVADSFLVEPLATAIAVNLPSSDSAYCTDNPIPVEWTFAGGCNATQSFDISLLRSGGERQIFAQGLPFGLSPAAYNASVGFYASGDSAARVVVDRVDAGNILSSDTSAAFHLAKTPTLYLSTDSLVLVDSLATQFFDVTGVNGWAPSCGLQYTQVFFEFDYVPSGSPLVSFQNGSYTLPGTYAPVPLVAGADTTFSFALNSNFADPAKRDGAGVADMLIVWMTSYPFPFEQSRDTLWIIAPDFSVSTPDLPEILGEFRLIRNVPNPFTAQTSIHYALPGSEAVEISIYDLAGRLVRQLVERTESAGNHRIEWDGESDSGRRVSPGVYFIRMVSGNNRDTRRVVMLR